MLCWVQMLWTMLSPIPKPPDWVVYCASLGTGNLWPKSTYDALSVAHPNMGAKAAVALSLIKFLLFIAISFNHDRAYYRLFVQVLCTTHDD